MKAFILAAGLGTRLRALGLDLPKVMVPIGGQPLLQHHFEWLRRQGVTEFILNLHYLPEKITDFFGDGHRFGVKITYSPEPELLGTAGGVKKMEAALRDGPFMVIYGDNLIRMELGPLIEFHRQRRAAATIALTTPESALVLNPGGAVVTPGVTPPAICPGSPGCPGYTAPGAAQPAPCELSGNCGSCSDGSDPLALGLNSDGSAMFKKGHLLSKINERRSRVS